MPERPPGLDPPGQLGADLEVEVAGAGVAGGVDVPRGGVVVVLVGAGGHVSAAVVKRGAFKLERITPEDVECAAGTEAGWYKYRNLRGKKCNSEEGERR